MIRSNDIPRYNGEDNKPAVTVRRDFSGGINTRQHAARIAENQAEELTNWDIGVAGETTKAKGLTLVEDLGNDAGTGLFGYEPDGGTNQLVATHGTKLETYTGTGTFTERKTNFTTGLATTILQAAESGEGDVFLVCNGTDNWFRFEPGDLSTPQDLGSTDNTGTDSPPKSTVGLYYRNRFWVLKDIDGRVGNLWFSTAYPSDYAVAFDTRAAGNGYRIPCGSERALIGLREQGIIIIGSQAVWGLNPSVVPAATDKPEKILDIGCVAGRTAVQVADDVLFLAPDGVRGVFRTQQDKLQLGQSYPLSYPLKTQLENVSWGSITKACAVWFDNKYFLSLPTASSTSNNSVWIYYPTTHSWVVLDGWNVAAWSKVKFSGEERLYAIDSTDGSVYRAWNGTTVNEVAMTATFIGREEDMGAPLQYKNGGELEIETEASGSDDAFTVTASINGQPFQSIGTVDLASATAPVLPINLPFNLADSYIIRQKFHIESLGRWKTLQVKIVNNDANTDPVKLYAYSIMTFVEEYENE